MSADSGVFVFITTRESRNGFNIDTRTAAGGFLSVSESNRSLMRVGEDNNIYALLLF